MAEILHFEILRKHGQTNTHTHTQTNKHTDMGITIPRPPPMGGEVITFVIQSRRYVSSPLPGHHVAYKPVLGKWFSPGVRYMNLNRNVLLIILNIRRAIALNVDTPQLRRVEHDTWDI